VADELSGSSLSQAKLSERTKPVERWALALRALARHVPSARAALGRLLPRASHGFGTCVASARRAKAHRSTDQVKRERCSLFLTLLFLLLSACRTGRPAGEAIAPLAAPTAEAATARLREERQNFRGMRSLMRVRATTDGKTQSFRAQLAVFDAQRMELIAYTPVGTRAMTMTADGDRITTDPEVAPASFDFLRAAGLTPAETAMLLLGLPPNDELIVEMTPAGPASTTAGQIRVVFEPPAFPAKHVVITRGTDRVELEHVEVVREN